MEEKKCKYCSMMIPKDAKICPHCRKKQGLTVMQGIGIVVVALFLIGYFGGKNDTSSSSSSSASSSSSNSEAANVSPKDEAMAATTLKYNWYKGGFDNVMEANFTIENNSKHNIKDITIKCTHYAPSGTEIDSNTKTIYETVYPQEKKKIRKFNMGFIHTQAQSTNCVISDLKAY